MYCSICKIDHSENPLIRNDGQLFCPVCLSSVTPKMIIEITSVNQSYYLDSEVYYNQQFIMRKERKGLIKCLEAVRTSAYLHNPNAIIAIGYYYEREIIETTSDNERVNSSLLWYNVVASYNEEYNNNLTKKARQDTKSKDFELYKVYANQALYNIYCLLLKANGDSYPLLKLSRTETINQIARILDLKRVEEQTSVEQLSNKGGFFLDKVGSKELIFGVQKVPNNVAYQFCDPKFSKINDLHLLFKNFNVFFFTSRNPDIIHIGNYKSLQEHIKNTNVANNVGEFPDYYLGYSCKNYSPIIYKKNDVRNRISAKFLKLSRFVEVIPQIIRKEKLGNYYKFDIILLDNIRKTNNIVNDTIFDCLLGGKSYE